MKIICTFLTLLLASTFYAQISSGQITYGIRMLEYGNSSYGDYDDSDSMGSTVRESSYTIDFNENFIRSFASMEGMNGYMSIQDKKTRKLYVSSMQEENKTIHFLDISSSEPDYSDSGYYDEEIKEPEISQYHEDFYKDLMRIPLNDTTVILTDETKDILGFSCKKTIMKMRGETLIVWTTGQITGIEQIYNFPKLVRGTVLEMTSKRKSYEASYIATSFSTQTTLNNDEFSFVPEGYRLDLGNIYLESYTKNEYSGDINFSIPIFIDASNYEEVLKSVLKELDNANRSKVKEEYDYSFFVIRIDIDGQGKIVSIEPEEEPENARIDWKKLNKNVKKNCSFKQPVKINGKNVPSVITINYSYINRKKEAYPDKG